MKLSENDSSIVVHWNISRYESPHHEVAQWANHAYSKEQLEQSRKASEGYVKMEGRRPRSGIVMEHSRSIIKCRKVVLVREKDDYHEMRAKSPSRARAMPSRVLSSRIEEDWLEGVGNRLAELPAASAADEPEVW